MIESLAEYFYDPLVFWIVPLVLVVLISVLRRLFIWGHRYFTGMSQRND
jgi:hypothetical protein